MHYIIVITWQTPALHFFNALWEGSCAREVESGVRARLASEAENVARVSVKEHGTTAGIGQILVRG